MKKYLVVIEKGEKNFSAYSPDVLGVAAVGDTIEETMLEMRGALEFSLEDTVETGKPVPEPRGVQSYLDAVEMSGDGEYFMTHLWIEEPHSQPLPQ